MQQFQDSVTTRGERRPLTLIVNLNNNHWVTLVVSHQDGQYSGYYADSLGNNVPDDIRQVLQQNRITNLNDVSILQQTDGHNCGLWALENARDINAVLQGSRSNIPNEIHNHLQVQRDENHFISSRRELSERLSVDQERRANVQNIRAEAQQTRGGFNPNNCVGQSSRSKRSINNCLFSKGDVERFSKGKVDENYVDKVIIDSEKFLTYVKNSQDEAKNAQLVEFIGNKNIEGDYKYLVDKVIGDQGYERYIQNERIKDLQVDVLQQNSGLTKNPKLKSRLMNAAGGIQLIRGIHGAIVSCKDGTATDCGLNLGGIGWSFASQPIENVMVKITPRVVTSAEKIVGKIIPGTLGKQTKFVIQVAGVKFGSTVAKGVAGAVGGVFDIIDIGISANNLVDCKNRESSDNPCGEKEIRDNIATISFSGVSFVSGIALTAASMPVVGIAVGFGLMVGQGVYSGISNIVEYEKKYDTTYGENWSIFWRTILFQDMASDVQHLADRKNTVDSLAKEVWEALNNAPNSVVAYGVGLGKVSDNTLRPDYAKILMDKEDTNTRDLSRVIPNPIPGASRICLPKITTQDYEKGIKNSVQPPLYYCENSMVISHDGRNGKTIVYDLRNIDKGEIVGSNKWNNNFLIYPGTTKITGGNNVENRFVLVNNPSFLGKIIGGSNSINILDLSQLVEDKVTGVIGYHFKPSAYGELKVRINDRLLIDDYVSNNLFNYHYIGRQNKVDEVLCMGYSEHFTESDNRDVIIDSGGGVSRNKKDVVKNCRKVIISPYTTVKGRESNYTFYVKTADYEGKSLYSEIDVHGTGTVNFPEFDLLSDCDQITYSKDSNTLSLKINFGQNDQFTLDIKNYFEQSSNKPHFVLIDKNGSNIVPKIERSDSATIKINSFELHSEHSLGNFKDIENHYKKILNNNKDYKVLSVIRGKTQNQNDSDMVFGSSGDDVINFDQGTMFARGGKGSDVYVITDDINNKEVKIDNNSDDEKVDTLFIPEVEKGFSIQQCDLHLNYSNISIQVKNYLQDHNHRHFIIMNKKGEAFIPNIQLMSCSSPEKGKLVPFLQATQTQNMFLLPKDFADDHIVIDSHLEDIKKYKDKDDLLMIRESEIPFIIRIEGFYTDRSKWENISYSLWNNNDLLPSPELLEDVDSVMEYQDKLRDDYKKVAKEYIIDFSNSINIEHNQKLEKHILTFVGQEEERIGVMILKNVAPDQIEVSSRDIDLILRDKRSNHTVNIKGWNNNKSYRISTLEFDLGLEPITIRRLDRFSLSEVEKIQDLIGKASENYQNRDKYTPKTENDFKCLISIDSFESENRNPTYQCLGFSSLQDQISFTENFCSLEQLTEFRDKSNSTQVSALSKNLQNDLSLSGYDQNIADKCSKLILAEENNQQSKISSMVKSVEESTFLGQSENKLDLGRCLSERKKRSSDFCPAFLENIYNELNREESERRNIVVEESSVRVIASDHETLDIENLPIREVVINDNINRKRSLRSTLDLRKLVQQINEDLGIKPISVVIKDGSDLLIKVSISVDDLQQDVMTVRLKDALINKWYKKLQIIFNNTPMEIDDSLDLKPSLLISDKEIVVITPQDVEEKNKLVISKKAGQYAFLYSGYDLIVTNAFNANMELCIIYFKDFYKEPKMKTLSIRFTDKEILLSDEIDKIYNADSIDKLNYVSSITNLQKSLITSLHLAAQNGDLDQVKLLFDNCGNIEAQDEFGKTPILCAAEAGKWSIVKFLLDNGANINNETTYQETPLHCAVQEGNLDIVKFLFDRGADIESQNAYNEKPLHLAIKAGRLDILKLLLDRGANINAKDKDGKTPLDVAKDQKHDVIIQYLEQAQLNEQLLAAVQDSDFSKVKDLINLGADVNIKDKDGKTPLHYVSRSDHHLGMVKYLISKGADIDVKDNSGRTPEDEERYTNSGTIRQVFMQAHLDKELLLTVKNEKDLKTISDLIVKDIDDRTHGGFYYTWSGNLGTVEFLVSKDVSVNATDKYGCTLLHWSALKGHSDIAKFLVDRGANVNAKDILGRTPIHFAVMNNHVNITELLLKQKVSVDETDKNGSTSLHYAAEFGQLDSARFLIDKRANINTVDKSGKKPIHIASENNNKNIIELFLSKGVRVDDADKDGWTSLHYAARRGCLGATEFLIEKGADTKAKDKNGQVPLCVAAQYNKPDIIDFLLNRGATIEASDFNDGPILKLAYCIKGVMEKISNQEQISHFEELKSKLPESIKNTVFSSKVCIKNLYQNEYLYADSSGFNYDDKRRRVFTWIPGDKKDGKFKWKIEPYGDGYSIMNVEFNEYLYAAIDDFNFDKDRRKAFTWIPGGKDEQSLWRLEYFPNDGNIYMMNVEFYEYLYAADYGKYDDNRRRVFTWIPGGYPTKGAWRIENCESIHRRRDIQELDGKAGSDSLEAIRVRNKSSDSQLLALPGRLDNHLLDGSNRSRVGKFVSQVANTKDNEEKDRPAQRKRRHHHGDHNSHHLSRKPRAIDSSNQPEIVASGGTRPSSWISGLLGWVKSSVSGLVSSVADKFAAEESENSKLGDTGPCSVGLEKMYSAIIPQSRKSLCTPKGNIPNRIWSSNREKVRSNVTVAPEISTAVVNSALILGDLAVRFMNGTRYEQPIHENLLSPRERSMRFIDEDMIIRAIQQGKEKFGVPGSKMDEVEIIGNKTEIGK
ncbi:MAG: ankyrin repeat domain-containing protein [Wolbachia pipientis]